MALIDRARLEMKTWRRLSFIALVAVSGLPAMAQRMSMAAHSGASHLHQPNPAMTRGARFSSFRHASPYGPGYGSLPFPFFTDSFDPGDIYSTGYPVSSQPPQYLMQALQSLVNPANGMGSMMGPQANQPASSEPLMIELQNDRYVRVNRAAVDGEAQPIAFANQGVASNSAGRGTAAAQPVQRISAAPLPPAVLIFRDGRSEEVRDYTIADGVLYARGDYYTDGYWNKKIDLANLNVTQTLEANAGRNVKFVLPSSPNEVITRP
jgi:hypothetical protein